MNKFINIKQIISFGGVGIITTFLNLIVYWAFVNFGINYLIVNCIAFIVTVFISYVLNGIFTFNKKNDNIKSNFKIKGLFRCYFAYFFTGIILNSTLLFFWNDVIKINVNISPILNLFFTIPINYIINKTWVFSKGRGGGG